MQSKIVSVAKSWLNTPYHHNAKIKGVGVDCGQILIAVFEEAGALKPGECNPVFYHHDWQLHRSEEKYLEWILKYCNPITGEPQPGDIAMFRYGKTQSHSAIIVEWPFVIHSYVRLGVIESNVNEAIFLDENGKSRLSGVYRFKGW